MAPSAGDRDRLLGALSADLREGVFGLLELLGLPATTWPLPPPVRGVVELAAFERTWRRIARQRGEPVERARTLAAIELGFDMPDIERCVQRFDRRARRIRATAEQDPDKMSGEVQGSPP